MKLELSNIQESLEFLSTLISNIPSAVFIIDKNVRVVKANDAFNEVFPYASIDCEGELCGNCLGCVYAVEEGKDCGKTSYCGKCNIRKAINKTIKLKEPVERQRLMREFYQGDDKKMMHLVFSTKYIQYKGEDMGLVIVDDMTETEQLKAELEEKNRFLNNQKEFLQNLVDQQTDKIKKMTLSIVAALENANRYNDTDTGNHIKRVSEYAALLAEKLGCDYDYINKIRLYASLHDIGKVGMPDDLLKKPGTYTFEEREAMKEHVTIGVEMLRDTDVDEMARNIIYYHHCKYDGTGYNVELRGKEIPLEARIVTLVDVYDALTTKRVYKPAFTENKAEEIIKEGIGTHFDPDVVNVFFEYKSLFEAIKQRYGG